jgi:chromosomal replication initiator protein
MREKGNYSFAEIGKELSHRNHATIIHGCQKIRNEIKTNPELHQQVLEIQEKLDSQKVL